MFPLKQHTLFVTLAGSQAHGTARAGSDVDLRGVCVAPLALRLSLYRSFEQYEGALPPAFFDEILPQIRAHPTAAQALDVKTECVIFDVAKFIGLCAAANPNALEILFADERDWVFETPAWRSLYDQRHRFLTKKVQQTFHGYAMAQLKKIKTHRSWLMDPPKQKPSRKDFGLPVDNGTLSPDDQHRIEQSIAEKLRSYGVDDIDLPKATRVAIQERLSALYKDVLTSANDDLDERLRAVATRALQLPPDVVATLNAEKRYRAAMKRWSAYQAWKTNRNPARAELEREHGYDTKHAMHLLRLMRMGVEALETGTLHVRREDAKELLAIRDGAMSYEALLAEADALKESMQRAAAATRLPADVDRDEVDTLLLTLLQEETR